MSDARHEGREESREQIRVDHLNSVIEIAKQRRDARTARAKLAIAVLGVGSISGTSVLLRLDEAENLADKISSLEANESV